MWTVVVASGGSDCRWLQEAMLWDRVEETYKVIVGGMKVNVIWGVVEISAKMVPQSRGMESCPGCCG